MSKNSVKIIVFFILIAMFINAFSESYVSHSLTNLAYVLALGIDVGEKAKLKITAQFSKATAFDSGGGSSDSSSQIVMVSGEADSIFSGINLLNSYIGKELNLAHCNVVVFSEELAKNGIGTQIYSLINNEEIRPSTNILVSKCSAYDYLNNVRPNIEKLTIQYFDTFSITSRLTGYISNLTIGEFYNNLSSEIKAGTAILGGLNATARTESSERTSESSSNENSSSQSSSSESSNQNSQSGGSSSELSDVITNPEDLTAGSSSVEGERGTENIGLAVFNGDKLCGELTAIEAISHLLIKNKVDSCIVSINNPYNNSSKVELQLYPTKKSKISVDINDDVPHISIELKIDADILTLDENIDYGQENVLETFSNATTEYLEKEICDYLNKVSKEYSTDIDNFGNKALAYFATSSEWKDFNWSEKFKNAEFDVNVDVTVISSLLITKT
mgnify:CR=1 FL=1